MSIPLLLGTLFAVIALGVVLYPLFFYEDEAVDAEQPTAHKTADPTCPACGAAPPAGARFCTNCGAKRPGGMA